MKPTVPFNIGLLQLNPQHLRTLRPVTSLDILESSKQSFHPQGLWSTEIFGNVGHEKRMSSFAYIDIKTPILHPVMFKQLVSAKSLYREIMAGESYATFSHTEQDFIRSNPIDGETGYQFFMTHYPKLVIKDTNTLKRDQFIRLFEKYKELALNDKIIVIPAGLRDVEWEDGLMKVDDVNNLYRKLISLSNNVTQAALQNSPETLDVTRYALQQTFVQLYEYLSDKVEGKKKLFLGRFASRRIFNGTRNVITAISSGGRVLGDPANIRHNNTVVGLFQMMKAILPVAKKGIRDGFLAEVFTQVGAPVELVNPTTLQKEEVYLDPKYYDRYQSDEGMESLIQEFSHESLRHKPLMIEGRYLGLMYRGPDDTFKIIRDIREVPADRDRSDVSPLTYAQLLYCSLFEFLNNEYPMLVVRYPIAGLGSTPPTLPFVKTTVKSERRYLLNEYWEKTDKLATSFPVDGDTFVNAMSPASNLLGGLSADFDGDTMSGNAVYSDEAREEIKAYLNSFKAYIDTSGRITRSMNFDTVKFICYNLSQV